MRNTIALLFLLAAACSVEGDGRNEAIKIDVDDQALEQTADEVANAAEGAASEIGNAAEEAGEAIESEVGNLDVDIDVDRNKSD